MKKVLVTGGAGFVGSNIVDELIKKKYKVVVIDNLSTGKKEYLNPKAIFYNRDITCNISDIFYEEKPDIVIHTAAQVMLRYSIERPIFDAKINICGTLNVLEECRKNNVKKIIYTSTGGARVGEPEYLPVDEGHPLNPCSPYGISKHTAEHYVWMYNKLYGLDYLIFCFGNVYGPRDNADTKRLIPLFIENMLNRKSPTIFGDGTQTRDFLFVLDLSKFIVGHIDSSPKHKLFHLADGKQVSVNEVVSLIKKHLKFKGSILFTEAVKGEVKDIVLDISLAKKELRWNPKKALEEGIKETINYFKNK